MKPAVSFGLSSPPALSSLCLFFLLSFFSFFLPTPQNFPSFPSVFSFSQLSLLSTLPRLLISLLAKYILVEMWSEILPLLSLPISPLPFPPLPFPFLFFSFLFYLSFCYLCSGNSNAYLTKTYIPLAKQEGTHQEGAIGRRQAWHSGGRWGPCQDQRLNVIWVASFSFLVLFSRAVCPG